MPNWLFLSVFELHFFIDSQIFFIKLGFFPDYLYLSLISPGGNFIEKSEYHSEAAGSVRNAQLSFLRVTEPKMTGARSAWARSAAKTH